MTYDMCYDNKKEGTRMKLKIGSTYRIKHNINDSEYVVKVTGETEYLYKLNVLELNGVSQGGYSGTLHKGADMLTKGKVTELHSELPPMNAEATTAEVRKRKRTPDEVTVDKLIEHVQKKIRINELAELIDAALVARNHETFIQLSKEYTKLKGKMVTA